MWYGMCAVDSVMCNLIFECGDVHGVVRGAMWACEMVC